MVEALLALIGTIVGVLSLILGFVTFYCTFKTKIVTFCKKRPANNQEENRIGKRRCCCYENDLGVA